MSGNYDYGRRIPMSKDVKEKLPSPSTHQTRLCASTSPLIYRYIEIFLRIFEFEESAPSSNLFTGLVR